MTKSHSEIDAKFEDRYIPEPNSGCYIWIGPVIDERDQRGLYGRFFYNGTSQLAHHYPFGRIEQGQEVHHKCRNTLCVRKEHLQVVTRLEHRIAEGRSNPYVFTACGHPKSKENTYVYGTAKYCRTCNARRHREKRLVKT